LRSRVGPSPVASLSAFARLLSSLAVLEQKEGKLNPGSLAAVTAAQKLGGPVTAFVAGSNIKPVAEEAAKVAGIEKIIAVDNGAYDRVRHWFAQRKSYNYSLLTLHSRRDCQKTMLLF
jgi:electron transfer flavoprotein alpha subunit